MKQSVRNLTPQALWSNFADLNAVPRASKKEERVIAFMEAFGNKLNLSTYVDEIGNVIIKKPATIGMENRQTVALQSHLDMVHQKNAGTQFNFDTEGIKMLVEDDWVKADGTTLGADNGIGVATIMAILASEDIVHPTIEALFTIDEETGLTGAMGFKGDLLDADIMLNLDTEDDDELTIGCAGGIDVTGKGTYKASDCPSDSIAFKIQIKGLTGGHSGMDIHKGRGNANKLLNRLLYDINKSFTLNISEFDGGGLRNAIPREAYAIITIQSKEINEFKTFIKKQKVILLNEYKITDPDIELTLTEVVNPSSVLEKSFQDRLIRTIYACPNGVYRMSPNIEGLVQTSNNIARVLVKEGQYAIKCLTRGSVDSEKTDMAMSITSTFELLGATVSYTNDYPGWEPKPDAQIIQLMSQLYKEMFNADPHVNACHAGLECGILGTHYPDMQMISFGPNIRGAHSPDEKVQISSVQKFWNYLLETLKRIPPKA